MKGKLESDAILSRRAFERDCYIVTDASSHITAFDPPSDSTAGCLLSPRRNIYAIHRGRQTANCLLRIYSCYLVYGLTACLQRGHRSVALLPPRTSRRFLPGRGDKSSQTLPEGQARIREGTRRVTVGRSGSKSLRYRPTFICKSAVLPFVCMK